VELLPHPGVPPGVEVVRHGLPRRVVVRQHPPGAPAAGQVEDGVHDVPEWVGPLASAAARWAVRAGEQVGDVGPLEVGQVTRVTHPCGRHAERLNSTPNQPEGHF
jgi:hypothetical protein